MTLAVRTMMFSDLGDGRWYAVNATGIDNDDTSQAFSLPRGTYALSLQTVGNHDSGTVSLQASNDGVTYAALPTAVATTAAGIKSVAAADLAYRYYKISTTGGGASHSVVVHLVALVRD